MSKTDILNIHFHISMCHGIHIKSRSISCCPLILPQFMVLDTQTQIFYVYLCVFYAFYVYIYILPNCDMQYALAKKLIKKINKFLSE